MRETTQFMEPAILRFKSQTPPFFSFQCPICNVIKGKVAMDEIEDRQGQCPLAPDLLKFCKII